MPGRRAAAEPGDCDVALAARVATSLDTTFPELRRTVRKTLAVVCTAFLAVLAAARGGNGAVSLAALARVLPSPGRARARETRLGRFLDNRRVEGRAVSTGLARLCFRPGPPRVVPVLFDQTQAGSTQALVVAVPFEGRALPLAVWTFTYPWRDRTPSQNTLEELCLTEVETSLPAGVTPVWIGDRGYARARLLGRCRKAGRLFCLRGRGGTRVAYQGRTLKLRELPAPADPPVRYPHVLYHARQRIPVDVIAYHDPAFSEPWHLVVPAGSDRLWSAETIVALYRERMQIEQSFRDFKTHLGLRGLHLKVRVAERMGRLLRAFCVAYALLLLLGVTPEGQAARQDLEVPRGSPRHGTTRTQSVLSIARLMLNHPHHRPWAFRALHRVLGRLARGLRVVPETAFCLALGPLPP
jgi:hypothetical protein